ncbi:MAG: conjugal transfer protein TrbH [Gammaproteobacteria bacterium]
MQKSIYRIFFSLLFVFLSGCITTNYGNFSEGDGFHNKKMVSDTVKQLAVLYPPAQTRFAFRQPTSDAFGSALISALRSKGYAISEFDQEQLGASKPMSATNTKVKITEIPLNYIVDNIETNIYRITVITGNQSITRAYMVRNGNIFPAGAWVRKE